MMTLEEAIKHCKDIALSCTNKECALEHFQLLKWLQEYSNMLEKQGESDETKAKMFLINKGYPIDANGTFPTYEEMYNIIKEGLEKQGEHKPADIIPQDFEKYVEHLLSLSDGEGHGSPAKVKEVSTELFRLAKLEQKPTDKVEPKFHEGEWITNGDYTWKIVEVKPLDYILQSQKGNIVDDTISHVDEQFHSFTIKDAKDGDVLATEPIEGFHSPFVAIYKKQNEEDFGSYCFIGFDGKFYKGEDGHSTEEVHPATKEQRDTLFAKMKEEGYEWDAEKKELKEIEQKSVFKMKTPEESLGIDSNTYNKIVDECIYGEQKPADVEEISFFEDFRKMDSEIEPKFKVGDWVVRGKTIVQILDIQEQYYIGLDIDGNDFTSSIFLSDNKIHLWTIQDANDGDVLACENGWTCIFKKLVNDETFSSYCFMDNTKWFCETGSECHTLKEEFVKAYNGKIYPATKEQHDLLFTKMKEAGYEWDAKNKELKKIIDKEQIKKNLQDNSFRRMFEQEFAWSEEDNEHLERILKELENQCQRPINNPYLDKIESDYNWLKSLKDRVQPKQEWNERDEQMLEASIGFIKSSPYPYSGDTLKGEISKTEAENWIKFLKDRYTWKPSEEQMNAFDAILVYNPPCSNECRNHLITLYNDLKKLKD